MAVIRFPVKPRANLHAEAATEASQQTTRQLDTPAAANDRVIALNILWLSLLMGASISVGMGVGSWSTRAGLTEGTSSFVVGALAFVLTLTVFLFALHGIMSSRH